MNPSGAVPLASLRRRTAGFVAALGVIACGGDDSPTGAHGGTLDVDIRKVDPTVVASLSREDSLSVIVLGQTQLLERVGGLEQFQIAHEGSTRQALRTEVVARLRTAASADQQQITSVLGEGRRVRRLWIYNAVAGTLAPSEIAELSRLASVAYIFANFGERVVFPTGAERASLVLPSVAAPQFDPARAAVAWNVRWLQADRVWRGLGVVGDGVVIASIDDGVNYAHADLRSHIWSNVGEVANNGRDDDGNGYADDTHGYDFAVMSPDVRSTSTAAQHGTWTAGLMVGDGTGGVAAGIAPRAKLMVLRASGVIAVAEAVQYAVAMGADVVNMSFTYRNEGQRRALWRMMGDHAVAAGLVLAGGAGNFQMTATVPTQIGSPKDVPSVLVAGGVDTTMRLLPFSSIGPVEWGSVPLYRDYPLPTGLVKPDVVAFPGPGLTVLGLSDAGYLPATASIQGNSFSGPQVAGIAALVMSAAPSMPGWKARAIIEATARDIAPAGKDPRTGHGLVDAWAAVNAALASRAVVERLEAPLELITTSARDLETRAIGEDRDPLSPDVRLHSAHAREVHDRRLVNAQETTRVQTLLERTQRLAQHVHLASDVQLRVVVGTLDPIQVACRNDDDLPDLAHDQASNTLRAVWRDAIEERHDLRAVIRVASTPRMCADALDGLGKALARDWLEQVVHRVHLERADRVLVVRRGEDDGRKRIDLERLDELEPCHAGHLHVDEQGVWYGRFDACERRRTIAERTRDFDTGMHLEQLDQSLARERLVVDHHHSNDSSVAHDSCRDSASLLDDGMVTVTTVPWPSRPADNVSDAASP